MDSNDKENLDAEHYVCLGGCRGVSATPGACQASACAHRGQALVSCACTDGEHGGFEPRAE